MLLFGVTFFTTSLASALHQGADVFSNPPEIVAGFPFAVTILTILLCHEMGHYFFARYHRVDVTLPYFIPAPPLFFVGTLGAFIRIQSIIPNRRALFDIGAAGPFAGFVVAVPATILGLMLSEIRHQPITEGALLLGEPLIFRWLTALILGVDSEDVTIVLHPIALAGWFGFFVTTLNLIPAGQLDGGHVVYSVFGRYHAFISRGTFVFLIVLGSGAFYNGESWMGWILWATILAILGFDHPPPHDSITPLSSRRRLLAFLTGVILAITFTPNPFMFAEPDEPLEFEGERTPVSAPAERTTRLLIAL